MLPPRNFITLVNMKVAQEHINSIRNVLPELPPITRARLKTQYGLSPQNIDVLMSVDSGREVKFDGEDGSVESGIVWYFEQLCSGKDRGAGIERNPKAVVNWYESRCRQCSCLSLASKHLCNQDHPTTIGPALPTERILPG